MRRWDGLIYCHRAGEILIGGDSDPGILSMELLAEGAREITSKMACIWEFGPAAVEAAWWAVAKHACVVIERGAVEYVILWVVGAAAGQADHRRLREVAAINRMPKAVASVALVC